MAGANDLMAETSDRSPTEQRPSRPGHSWSAWLLFAVALAIVAVLIVVFGWLPRHKQEEKVAQEANERTHEKPKVNVVIVKRAPSASELMVPGTTLAYTEAYVYARASGYVSRRYVDIGDRVRAGQLLATIDSPDLDQQVAQARSNVRQSESTVAQLEAQLHLQALNWDRYKVLVTKGVFSRQQGDQQEADFRVAEANVAAAQSTVQANKDNLERLLVLQRYEQVTAPFSGVITARNVDVGALISAAGSGLGVSSSPSQGGTTQSGAQGNNEGSSGNLSGSSGPATGGSQGGEMFGMAAVDRLRVFVSVPEAYGQAVRIGQRAQLFFQETPSQEFEGHVTRTSASIDQNTRTLLVEVQLANPQGRLMPGMYVVVNFIDVQGARPLMIPGEAIVVRNAKQTVALIQNNTIHFSPITIGRDYGDQTEVASGLNEGDVIAGTVNDEVRDGVEIEPQYPPQPSAPTAGGAQQDRGQKGQYGEQGLNHSAQKANKAGGSKGR
jgi:multidrug efflux pump subunit AcrA (membrane-fusion protein)